jgi:hypothetical protein
LSSPHTLFGGAIGFVATGPYLARFSRDVGYHGPKIPPLVGNPLNPFCLSQTISGFFADRNATKWVKSAFNRHEHKSASSAVSDRLTALTAHEFAHTIVGLTGLFRPGRVSYCLASSVSSAFTRAGSSGVVFGAKRAVTLPPRSTTNFSKFQRSSGSLLVSIP